MRSLSCIIVSSPGEPHWLGPCLASLRAHAQGSDAEVIVVENDGSGAARDLVADHPGVRVVECENHGFGHANNQGLRHACGRHLLFLNPDTEVRAGDLAELVRALDARPRLGAASLRQVDRDGRTLPTLRRFPTPLRALGEALVGDRLTRPPALQALISQRIPVSEVYDREARCDWASGSSLVIRREALDAAGWFDERFFLYAEETDLCRRIRDAGFEVGYLPLVTVFHDEHGGRAPGERMLAQLAWSRRHYARKHLPPVSRAVVLAAAVMGAVLRRGPGWRRVVRILLTGARPPYEPPPATALRPPATA